MIGWFDASNHNDIPDSSSSLYLRKVGRHEVNLAIQAFHYKLDRRFRSYRLSLPILSTTMDS